MGAVLLIIGFIVLFKYADYKKDQAIDRYDISKINTAKLTADMNKPLSERERNLLAGKYDYKEGEIDALGKRR